MNNNIYKNIKDISDEWCESLSTDKDSIKVCEITEFKINMLKAFKNFETNGIEHDGVRKTYEGLNDILNNMCDKFFSKENY